MWWTLQLPRVILSTPDSSWGFRNVTLFCLPATELYSYTENLEFTTNRRCFEEDFRTQGGAAYLFTEACYFLHDVPV